MSRLPWCDRPTGIGAIGRAQCSMVESLYPGQLASTGYSDLYPSRCGKTTIYETGSGSNPNTHM
jgi:hypothetical protein